MAGLLTGCIRMILDFVYIAPSCGEEDTRPAIVKNVIIFLGGLGFEKNKMIRQIKSQFSLRFFIFNFLIKAPF